MKAVNPIQGVHQVAVVGLGNIGSQVVSLVPGVRELHSVVLIDFDCYEAANIGHQRIGPRDVGKSRAGIQARYLRKQAPHLKVTAWHREIDAVPPGVLAETTVLACVDSREARQSVNRIACALGLTWIDAGLDARGMVRVRPYVPQIGDCLECQWDDDDYAKLEQRYPCRGPSAAHSTAAPPELGAIAAGLQVGLLRSLASGTPAWTAWSQQWFLDVAHANAWRGAYSPNPSCRAGHRRWSIYRLGRAATAITLGEVLESDLATYPYDAIAVAGQSFVRRQRCLRCRRVRNYGLRLSRNIRSTSCRRCGGPLRPGPDDAWDLPRRSDIPRGWFSRCPA